MKYVFLWDLQTPGQVRNSKHILSIEIWQPAEKSSARAGPWTWRDPSLFSRYSLNRIVITSFKYFGLKVNVYKECDQIDKFTFLG